MTKPTTVCKKCPLPRNAPSPASIPGDWRSHVGIRNVRDRLRRVCGGTPETKTEIGAGTTATIILPKKQEEQPC